MISEKRVKEIIAEEVAEFNSKNTDFNKDGKISASEFVHKFDQDKDGIVTAQEFENQLLDICSNKHIVKPLLSHRESSHQSVPCRNTYDKASKYLAHDIDSVYAKSYDDICMECGAECPVSVVSAVLDILKSLEEMER